jgi:tripartite-type tricarboxylate transporter receptor subunit TctC
MPKPLSRRAVLGGLASLPILSTGAPAQRSFPDRPIRLIVPYGAGSATDGFTRQLLGSNPSLQGQPIVIENRAGANAIIGTEAASRSNPDGHTLFVGTDQTQCINPALFQKLPYDAAKDFVPVAGLARFPMVLVVSPELKANSVQELVALAKAQPGDLTYASPGIGTTAHLIAEIFQRDADIKLLHVPYSSSMGSLFSDLLTNKVSMMFYPYPPLRPHVEARRLRAIATAAIERPKWLPNVPTLRELSYQRSIGMAWNGVYAPAGTDSDRVARVSDFFKQAMANPQLQASLTVEGANFDYRNPGEFGTFTVSERERYRELVTLSGAKVE